MDQKGAVSGISCGPKTPNENQPNANQKANGGRCLKPGPIVRNPYLNFLRDFRKNNCGFSAVETMKRGAAAWKALPKDKRTQYIVEAFYAPRVRRRKRRYNGGSLRLRGSKLGRIRRSRGIAGDAKSAAKISRRSRVCARPRIRRRFC